MSSRRHIPLSPACMPMTSISDLEQRLRDALDTSRRNRDGDRTKLLTTLLSDVKNRAIETRGTLDEADVVAVLARAHGQRVEAARQMNEAGRRDLAEKEEAQARVIEEFLPPPLAEEDVRRRVRELVAEGVDQMGPLMGRLMPELRGRFDGGEASRIVREELQG
ncbi:MAG: GatB/YqeY domain-containing protein [Gemmatimonadales bacterium]|nr:MAG: GatB/YqeY domain-containing protein [Gemmatimonadales bacterium]